MDEALQSLLRLVGELSDQFRELREGVQRALGIAGQDPEMALIRSRKVLEYVVREVYERRVAEPPGTRPLENLLQRLVKDGLFPARLEAYANAIRMLGNVGAHRYNEQVTPTDVTRSLTQLLPILEWYFQSEQPGARATAREDLDSSSPYVPEEPIADSAPDEGDGPGPIDQFAASVRQHMATLNRSVERLTTDQFRIIRQLQGIKRVRISGCAGSGKTLVAAEKAIRLSNAGLKTLFLCHNPLLAEHVRQLTLGSGAHVAAFEEWIAELGGEAAQSQGGAWSNYEEPDSASLNRAFDALAGGGPYDAVIVDEGQDFRDEWWTVVEASLGQAASSTLYIFHDDFQAVLPYRARYPVTEPVLDLSRNCRNAGKVYELMRHLRRQAPAPEDQLKDLGNSLLITYRHGKRDEALAQAVRWVTGKGLGAPLVALHAGMPLPQQAALWGPFYVQESLGWQEEVRRKFQLAIRSASRVSPPAGGWDEVSTRLGGLSMEPVPRPADRELVREVAGSFRVPPEVRREVSADPRARAPMSWVIANGRQKLWKHGRREVWASEIIMHFEREDWHKGIAEPESVRFVRHAEARGPGVVPVYRVGDFKGLEADAVLFHLEGSVPVSKEELYVGISRARMLLALLVDDLAMKSLPLAFPTLC